MFFLKYGCGKQLRSRRLGATSDRCKQKSSRVSRFLDSRCVRRITIIRDFIIKIPFILIYNSLSNINPTRMYLKINIWKIFSSPLKKSKIQNGRRWSIKNTVQRLKTPFSEHLTPLNAYLKLKVVVKCTTSQKCYQVTQNCVDV